MIYLVIATILSSSIFIIFRYFKKFRVNNSQAITFNYLIASLMGIFVFSGDNTIAEMPQQEWFWVGIIEGVLFITVFFFFALSSQRAGVGITAVSSKMSVIIPVIFGYMLFGDPIDPIKIIGIGIALVAFYLSLKRNQNFIQYSRFIILPLLLFFGNGAVDTLLKTAEHFYLNDDNGYFLTLVFLTALVLGSTLTLFNIVFKKEKVELKNIVGGFILGAVNYLTTLATLNALNYIASSIYFPLYNSGIVALTALLGLVLFKEKYSLINWIGITLTIIAIVLISI